MARGLWRRSQGQPQAGVLFLKRLGTAAELASLVIELLVNTYANGETLRVDGGARLQPK